MISASGGKGGTELAPVEAPSFALISCSATVRSCFLQRQDQTTGGSRAAHPGITAGRQAQTPVEASLRQFEPMDRRGAQLLRHKARAGNDEIAVLDQSLRIVRVDARERDQHQNF